MDITCAILASDVENCAPIDVIQRGRQTVLGGIEAVPFQDDLIDGVFISQVDNDPLVRQAVIPDRFRRVPGCEQIAVDSIFSYIAATVK